MENTEEQKDIFVQIIHITQTDRQIKTQLWSAAFSFF